MNQSKKKKRLIESGILIILLAAGVAWLLLRPQGSVKYELPQFSPLAVADISSITWGKAGKDSMLLRKQDGQWVIGERGYPAAKNRFDKLLQQLSSPELGDLVAERGPYQKYGLDEKNRYLVQAHQGETIARSLLVGKASGGNYSYVSLPDKPQVYLLRANLTQLLDTKIDDLREKKVLSFNADAVTELKIEGPKRSITLSKVVKQEKEGKSTDSWQDENGKDFDLDMVKSTLNSLSSLYASGFSDQEPTGEVYTLTAKGDSFSHVLTVASEPMGKEDNDGYLAKVSGYDFPFILARYTVGSFLEDFGFIEKQQTK